MEEKKTTTSKKNAYLLALIIVIIFIFMPTTFVLINRSNEPGFYVELEGYGTYIIGDNYEYELFDEYNVNTMNDVYLTLGENYKVGKDIEPGVYSLMEEFMTLKCDNLILEEGDVLKTGENYINLVKVNGIEYGTFKFDLDDGKQVFLKPDTNPTYIPAGEYEFLSYFNDGEILIYNDEGTQITTIATKKNITTPTIILEEGYRLVLGNTERWNGAYLIEPLEEDDY